MQPLVIIIQEKQFYKNSTIKRNQSYTERDEKRLHCEQFFDRQMNAHFNFTL